MLQLFIVSLFFIAFGITLGSNTLPLSFFLLLMLTMVLLANGWSIAIDNTTKSLFVFFIIAVISVFYRLLVGTKTGSSFWGDTIETKGIKQLIMFFMMVLHFVVLRNILKKYDIKIIQNLLKFFVLICFLVALYSIYQFFAFRYDWPFTDILRTSKSYSITRGLEDSSWAGLPRARAFMPEPCFWGAFLLIPFSLVLPFVFERKKIALWLLLSVFVTALLLTFSRSCWFGCLFILVLFVYYKIIYEQKIIRTAKIFLIVTAGIILLLTLIVPDKLNLFQRLSAFSDFSSFERFEMQKRAFQIFLEYPILGVGFGNTPFFLNYIVTHNFYLQLLLETGIVGFFVFMLFLFQVWIKLKELEKKTCLFYKGEGLRSLILAIKLAFFSMLFTWIHLTAYNLSYIWFTLALITVLSCSYQKTGLFIGEGAKE